MAILNHCPVCRRFFSGADVCPHDGQQGAVAEVEPVPSVLEERFGVGEPFIQGDTGVGYLVHDEDTGREGLLKILRFVSEIHGSELMRIKRELSKQPGLYPRCLVPVIENGEITDDGQDGNLVWLFREWMEGTSLRGFLKREGALDAQTAIAIATQIATGLDGLHRAGLLHRDLKPGHVILQMQESGVPHAFLIDAGIAKRIENDSLFGVMGTPAYLSPEQATGKLVSFRSDLYALGCVLYEMLEGMPPFVGADTAALIEAHKNEPAPAPTVGLPDAVVSLMSSLLAKEPRQRPFSAQQVRRALEPFVHASTPHARATTMPPRSGGPQPMTVPPLETATGVPAPSAPPPQSSPQPSGRPSGAPPPPPPAARSSAPARIADGARPSATAPPPVGRQSTVPPPPTTRSSVSAQPVAAAAEPDGKAATPQALQDQKALEEQLSAVGQDDRTMEIGSDQVVEVLEAAARGAPGATAAAVAPGQTATAASQPPPQASTAERQGLPSQGRQGPASPYQEPGSAPHGFDREAFQGQVERGASSDRAEELGDGVDVDLSWQSEQAGVSGASETDAEEDVLSSRELELLDEVGVKEQGRPAVFLDVDEAEPVAAGIRPSLVTWLTRSGQGRAIVGGSAGLLLLAAVVYALSLDQGPTEGAELAAGQVTRQAELSGQTAQKSGQNRPGAPADPTRRRDRHEPERGKPAGQDATGAMAGQDKSALPTEAQSATDGSGERHAEDGRWAEPGADERQEPKAEDSTGQLRAAAEDRSSRRRRSKRTRRSRAVEEEEQPTSAETAGRDETSAAQGPAADGDDLAAQRSQASPEVRRPKAEELRAEAREHYRAGRYRKAAAAYLEATRLSPSHAGSFAGLGAASLAMGDSSTAIAAYQRAIRLSPSSSGFYAALGRAYMQKGDRQRAATAYRKALKLNPNNHAARWGLEQLRAP